MRGLALSLAETAVALLAAGAIGYALTGPLLPRDAGRCERAAWGIAIGLALLAISVPFAFLVHLPPAAIILATAALALAAAFLLRSSSFGGQSRERPTLRSLGEGGLLLLAVLGVALYTLRALTEPMWSNDLLAIWGFKGKTLFGAAGVPRRLFTDTSIAFSHPEYPLGLPFLYAALAFLLGRFDDHAMALLFPLLQAATLAALFGWLRRRGASRILALAAAALLAQFEALYSAFLTGLADVPFSLAALLFGMALADVLDGTDSFAARRLAVAVLLAVSIKNEGLLLVAAGTLVALASYARARSVSRSALAALLVPSAVLVAAGRLLKGNLPLRDFDLAYLTARLSELLARAGEALATAFSEVILPASPGLIAVAILIVAGRAPGGGRLLALVAICALSYLLVASLAVPGPAWLIRTSFARTVSALAPLAAAAIALRLRDPFGESRVES